MNLKQAGLSVILLHFFLILSAQRSAAVRGTITDQDKKPLFPVSVSVKGEARGTVTDSTGYYNLTIPANTNVILVYSHLGFKSYEDTLRLSPGQTMTMNLSMSQENVEIGNATVIGIRGRENTLVPINIKSFDQLPNPTGNVEAMLKTNASVVSNSELTSQYSVRGGSYDENLIYVNDVEIYRPLLVQSAQQEGLSFINPSMVKSIKFSAGGFGAEYGDKLSSVLDIKYRQPTSFEGSVSASLLGGSLHLGGRSKNHKFTHITGIRYKTTQYLLGTLDTKGDYKPSFSDLQTYLTYDLSHNLQLSFLGNYASNKFVRVPHDRETDFGNFQQSFNFIAYYEGQERDLFSNYMGAVTLHYHPSNRLSLKLIASSYSSEEAVNYDILAEYIIGQATQGSSGRNDSIVEIGTGGSLNHARDQLHAAINSIYHKGVLQNNAGTLKWGARAQHEYISDRIDEWDLLDSAGYSLPVSDTGVDLYSAVKTHNILSSLRFSGYLQQTFRFHPGSNNLSLTIGARGQYWTYNKQVTISPRGNLSFKRRDNSRFTWYFATGLYYQPPFYKELRDPQGKLYPNTKAQRALHLVLGTDYNFKMWDRPFVFTSELYYKNLTHLIPYKLDDVRLQYLPQYKAKGYATGVDFKMYGEFVPGMESWFSLSLLNTKEDIYNDYYKNPDGTITYPGYYRRPTDQLISFSIFFQDYLPANPNYKLFLMMIYGSGFPYSGPSAKRPSDVYDLGPYRRIDVGFSRLILGKHPDGHGIKSVWLSFEILNLVDSQNKVSYDWVRTVQSDYGVQAYFAVPNYLTGRAFNGKVTVNF